MRAYGAANPASSSPREEPAADLRADLRPHLRISGLNDTVVGRYAESDAALKRGVLVLKR